MADTDKKYKVRVKFGTHWDVFETTKDLSHDDKFEVCEDKTPVSAGTVL